MNTILIAGAGQLGSRHLQGVKTSSHELDIWVFDLSKESLKIAEERYNQVESTIAKTIHFVSNLESVPSSIDVVIVASSSIPRATIVKNILATKSVRYMVLEKFLFTRFSEYDEIESLLNEKEVTAWVNCPRRMWQGYDVLKSLIDVTKPIELSYSGGEWGMCCNTIHFVDIFMYLNGQNNCSFIMDGLLPEVIDSKRAGYVELLGTELFVTENGSRLILKSERDAKCETPVIIKNCDLLISYDESIGLITINGESTKVPVYYQSGLSGVLVDSLLETGKCKLTPYEISSSYHKMYLSNIAPYINKLKGWTSDSCPIT